MIVVAFRIDRDGGPFGLRKDRGWIMIRAVIDAKHHDRSYVWPQDARIAAPFRPRRHPVHFAVKALGQELREALLHLRSERGSCHRDRIEAERGCRLCESPLDVGRRGQKSRSA